MSAPEVSIAVLTYRRRAALERALASALNQREPAHEILVVDNAAEASLKDWLASRFPSVRYLAMSFNGGTAGRNEALRASSAQVVITIDDDVELADRDCVSRVRAEFADDPSLACLNFRVTDMAGQTLNREWCHPRPITDAHRRFETYFILEGACALRREAVLAAGGYAPEFFLGHEGIDLAYRLIDRGQRVMHTGSISAIHRPAQEHRPGWRTYYYYTRNGIWVAYRNFHAGRALSSAIENTAKMAFFALRGGHPLAYAQGVAAGVKGMIRFERKPLKKETYEHLDSIRAHRVPLRGRVQRHLRERIL